jgi:hypothetical protein
MTMGGSVWTMADIDHVWNRSSSNFEQKYLPEDFMRTYDPEYDPRAATIFCKDGGTMAVLSTRGIDPEVLSEAQLVRVRDCVRRAVEVFGCWQAERNRRRGSWEVQMILSRREATAESIPLPLVESGMTELLDNYNKHFQKTPILRDELLWVVKYTPGGESEGRSLYRKFKSKLWGVMKGRSDFRMAESAAAEQARFFRRQVKAFRSTLMNFRTERPVMDLGVEWLGEEEGFRVLWRQVNRRADEAPRLRTDLPLGAQLAASSRDNSGENYAIDGRLTKILTWKDPPDQSVANVFCNLQRDLRFPFTVVQNFTSVNYDALEGGLLGLARRRDMAIGWAPFSRHCARYAAEATALMNAVHNDRHSIFNWYMGLLLSGATKAELEDRVAQASLVLKRHEGGQIMEETRKTRAIAELSLLPGNARLGARHNPVTSRHFADLATTFKLHPGDKVTFQWFRDRQGGLHSCSLLCEDETCSNRAFLAPPGAGKTATVQGFLFGNMAYPSQAYVFDEGNSYGPFFRLAQRENPRNVSIMRFLADDFSFNTLNLVWALGERQKQKAAGVYRKELQDGDMIPCPVESEKAFFAVWLECFLTQGRSPLTGAEKNRLDLALRGESGHGGYFAEFERECAAYLENVKAGREDKPPRPLTMLRPYLKTRETAEFWEAIEGWTREPKAKYFDRGIDTVGSAKYIYFELSGLERETDLVRPFVMALTGLMWRRVHDPFTLQEGKQVVFDEVWKWLTHPAFMPMIMEQLRTGRKFKCVGNLVTQSPQDLNTGEARKLLQVMSEIYLWHGFSSDPEFLEGDLELGKHQIKQLRLLRNREVMRVTKRGMNRILGVEIPPMQYWYVTTDPDDKHWREVFCSHFGLQGGIRHLVKACGEATLVNKGDRLTAVAAYASQVGLLKQEERACA